jgi:hypothetical protein
MEEVNPASQTSAQKITFDKLYTHFSKCINDSRPECPEVIIDLEENSVLNLPITSNVEVDKIDGTNITKFRADENYFNALAFENKLYFFKVLESDDSGLGTTYYSSMKLPRVQIFQDGVFLSEKRNEKNTSEKLDCWQIKVTPPPKKTWWWGGRKSNKKRNGSKKNKNKKKKKSTQRK